MKKIMFVCLGCGKNNKHKCEIVCTENADVPGSCPWNKEVPGIKWKKKEEAKS
jgi:hypothetical protein